MPLRIGAERAWIDSTRRAHSHAVGTKKRRQPPNEDARANAVDPGGLPNLQVVRRALHAAAVISGLAVQSVTSATRKFGKAIRRLSRRVATMDPLAILPGG